MEFSELKYPYKTKFVKLKDNISLAYADEGENKNEAVVFIHGLASYMPAWKKNIPILKDHFRCIPIDLPGYGKSSKGDYHISMDFYADIIIEFLDKLELEHVTLAGHSMGGHISIFTALKYSDRISKLILASPAGFETFNEFESRILKNFMTVDLLINNSVKQLRQNVLINFYKMPKDAEFMIEDRIALKDAKDLKLYCSSVVKSLHAMLDEPVFEKFKLIKQQTLILFGENDSLIPNRELHKNLTTKSVAESGAGKINNSKLVMIPECGHFLPFEKPNEFNKEVIEFLHN
ncbi:MAG TPA: alpha/beta hydrolase [Ignavibacteria bacterium]|nr:alpha/beta hydrolase [Ignavibacteria bacterium]